MKLDDLKQIKQKLYLGGGENRISAQHKRGKMTARERINFLFDKGTFIEIGEFVTSRHSNFATDNEVIPGDGVITGFGKILGRTVYIASQDFTVMGGSVGEMHGKKIANILKQAIRNGAPFVKLNDSGGARIQEGISAVGAYAEVFLQNTLASGVIPQLSLIMGPCAGGSVYAPAITDFIIMVENTSHMFITGPQVLKTATNEDISMEELGSAEVHTTKSGVCAMKCADDESALNWLKTLLAYLPSNNLTPAPLTEVPTEDAEHIEALNNIIPLESSRPYNILEVINGIIDAGSFLEIFPAFAQNLVVGFAKLNGCTIGVTANSPRNLAGCLDINASIKGARFIRFCDAFNIPLVNLVDVPGCLPGVEQEHNGIIRNGAKLLYAYCEATVPKLTVILRKAYGGTYCSTHLGADAVFAWPTAEIAVMGPEGAANILFKHEIESAENPEEKRKEYTKQYTEQFANPKMAAELGYIDDIIEPAKTREILIHYLSALQNKKVENPSHNRKHGNMPL